MDRAPQGVRVGKPPPGPAKADPAPSWPASAQLVAAGLLLVVGLLLGWNLWAMSRAATRPTALEPGRLVFRTDLNRASFAELRQLPGVGEQLARRIDAHRQANGDFRRVEDLLDVPGIGAGLLERLRPLVTVEVEADGPATVGVSQRDASPGWTTVRKLAPGDPPLDPNRATKDELQRLPGIGPVLAGRIVETRRDKPFVSPNDLRRVSGIGPKTLEKVRPFVVID